MSVRKLIGPLVVGASFCTMNPVLAQELAIARGPDFFTLGRRLAQPFLLAQNWSQSFANLTMAGAAVAGLNPPGSYTQLALAATHSTPDQRPLAKQPSCQLALQAQAENPTVNQLVIGTVYSVIGNTVLLQLEDGSLRQVTRSWIERGYLGQLVGQRVALTDIYCSRITLAPPPPPVIPAAISVPALEFGPRTLQVPPVTPRMPYQRPDSEEQPAPAVIPQTW